MHNENHHHYATDFGGEKEKGKRWIRMGG